MARIIGNARFNDGESSVHISLGNPMQSSSSSLTRFGQAKETLSHIFKDIQDYIANVDFLFQETCESFGIKEIDDEGIIKDSRDKVNYLMDIIKKDRMNVIFFGNTSNGKSAVINAMLGEKVLPSVPGHTTNCFLQVEGTDSQKEFMMIDDKPDEHDINELGGLVNALSSEKLEPTSLIRIMWPKKTCRLLTHDVVFLDSPGTDMDICPDTLIEQFCLDADVFVLVANAESTLNLSEKNLLHKVKELISKPNVFILQNKWDRVFNDCDAKTVELVRNQHLKRSRELLVDDLGVTDREKERVFFVSAKEALEKRDKNTRTPTGTLQEGVHARYLEFETFESKFEECISKSAVKTKFRHRTEEGRKIIEGLKKLIESKWKCLEHKTYQKKGLKTIKDGIKRKIKALQTDVRKKVSSDLEKWIEDLSSRVKIFNNPFDPNPEQLNKYKTELHKYADMGDLRNLLKMCSAVLKSDVETLQKEITVNFLDIMPEETDKKHLPKYDFERAFCLDWDSLYADFKEDLTFTFLEHNKILTSSSFVVAGAGVVAVVSTVKLFLIGLVPVTLIPLVGYYFYERHNWDAPKMESALKEQFKNHAKRKLHRIVDKTSKEAQQKLSSTLDGLYNEVGTYGKFTKLAKRTADSLRNKADMLDDELKRFTEKYLEETV